MATNAKLISSRLLSVAEAAQHLGISRSLLYELMAEQKLRFVKIHRRRFVPMNCIDEFVASLTEGSCGGKINNG